MKYQVRRILSEDLSPIALAFFEFAFPGFFYAPGSEESLRKYLAKGGIDLEFFKRSDIPIGFATRLPRRYAGDVFGHVKSYSQDDLPRHRYGSLITLEGTDRGVLRGELLAYAGVETSIILVDSFDLPRYRTLGFKQGANEIIAVLEQNAFTGRFAKFLQERRIDLRSGGVTLRDTGWILVHLPCRTEESELTKVMDLRQPSCREAFYDLYYQGVPGFLNWPRCHGKCFADMLPHIYFQALGGSIVHEALGAHLRLNGYEGMIYPSARSDCSVILNRGVLSDSHGFNLVVYKDAPKPSTPKRAMLATYCPWSRVMPCENFNVTLGNTVDSEGSLYVSGIWKMADNNKNNKGYYFDSNPSSWPSLDMIAFGS
jgi:hypothetical protein